MDMQGERQEGEASVQGVGEKGWTRGRGLTGWEGQELVRVLQCCRVTSMWLKTHSMDASAEELPVARAARLLPFSLKPIVISWATISGFASGTAAAPSAPSAPPLASSTSGCVRTSTRCQTSDSSWGNNIRGPPLPVTHLPLVSLPP